MHRPGEATVTDDSATPDQAPVIDTSVPHSARVWNYWLGGKDNYAVDRMAGDQVMAIAPDIIRLARADRAFLRQAVTFLVTDTGIRQFLDVGTGLPTANNTHEVAQAIAPESRIVYVDNDPLVLVHARALLTSAPEGACDYIDADVRDPDKILAAAARTLDFTKPIAIMMLGVLGQIPDSDDPQSIINRMLDAVPSGSYLAISDGVSTNESLREAARRLSETSRNWYHLRSPAQISAFFDGLELVDPGVAPLDRWRPHVTRVPDTGDVTGVGGVGRKP
jgi:O-methyltransferase involved in polyketide biosynthesis